MEADRYTFGSARSRRVWPNWGREGNDEAAPKRGKLRFDFLVAASVTDRPLREAPELSTSLFNVNVNVKRRQRRQRPLLTQPRQCRQS